MTTIVEKITEMIKDCNGFELNMCLTCDSKEQCCALAYQNYNGAS